MISFSGQRKSLKEKGNEGEQRAVEYLEQKNYSILHRNWRTRQGEIDIIALTGEILVFAEVKTALHGNLKTLEYILGSIKQKRIVETAKYFLLDNRQYTMNYIRFDVLIINMPCYAPVYHIKNAFSEFV